MNHLIEHFRSVKREIYPVIFSLIVFASQSFGQEIKLTVETPTLSAGAEYSQFLEQQIKLGNGKLFEFNGKIPLLYKTQATDAITTIEGINFDEDAANGQYYNIPPDPIGAAGPSHLVSVTNTSIEWFTKAGVKQNSQRLGNNRTTAVGSFFESLNPLTGTFDPKVIYDQHNGRFVVVALEQTTSPQTSRILVAVSKTSDPNGGWWYTSIDSKVRISGQQSYSDYPGLAIGTNEIYITANMFNFTGGGFAGARLWIIAKAPFYSGGTASVNLYNPYPKGQETTYQPTQMFGTPPNNVGTFLVAYSGLTDRTNEYANIIQVNNPLGTPTFDFQQISLGNIDNLATGSYKDAPQLGTSTLINSNDRRTQNAVWRNNALWAAFTVVPNSGSNAGQVTAHWLKINTSNLASLSVSDQGDIGGEDIATGAYTFFPSIAVNSSGDAIIGFSASAPTIYPGAYYAGRYSTTPAGTVLASQVLKTGLDYYVRQFGGTRNRWGDYSGSSVDPSDDLTFYIFNQYALTRGTILSQYPTEDGRWGTAFGVVPPPALPVELSSFSASIIGSSIKLNWKTETEVNNYGFDIERSLPQPLPKEGAFGTPLPLGKGQGDGLWTKIGFVNGNGNSNSPKSYTFTDANVLSGKYSYRLKQIDNDGQFEYSKTIEVDLGAPKKFELSQNYPNPFNPTTTIRFSLPEASLNPSQGGTLVKLTVYNVLGQQVAVLVNDILEAGVHTINFNASELNSGIYIYKLEAGSFVQTRKMTLIK